MLLESMNMKFGQCAARMACPVAQCLGPQPKKFKGWVVCCLGLQVISEVPVITHLALDAGCLLGLQLNCQPEHLHMASPCGLSAQASSDSLTSRLGSKTTIKKCLAFFFSNLASEISITSDTFLCDSQTVLPRFKGKDVHTTPMDGMSRYHWRKSCEIQEIVVTIFRKHILTYQFISTKTGDNLRRVEYYRVS